MIFKILIRETLEIYIILFQGICGDYFEGNKLYNYFFGERKIFQSLILLNKKLLFIY